MMDMESYFDNFDDTSDSIYTSWVFKIPEKWKSVFDHIMTGNIHLISESYRNEMNLVYPKLEENFNTTFSGADAQHG